IIRTGALGLAHTHLGQSPGTAQIAVLDRHPRKDPTGLHVREAKCGRFLGETCFDARVPLPFRPVPIVAFVKIERVVVSLSSLAEAPAQRLNFGALKRWRNWERVSAINGFDQSADLARLDRRETDARPAYNLARSENCSCGTPQQGGVPIHEIGSWQNRRWP